MRNTGAQENKYLKNSASVEEYYDVKKQKDSKASGVTDDFYDVKKQKDSKTSEEMDDFKVIVVDASKNAESITIPVDVRMEEEKEFIRNTNKYIRKMGG